MTRIEHRLADALATRAKAVDPNSVRPLPWAAPVRHRRERRRRWLAPAAAAISIVVIAAVVAFVSRHAHAARADHPNPITAQRATFHGRLLDVDALSATNAWAVGTRFVGATGADALIMHWNGRNWQSVSVPPGAGGGELFSISGRSLDDLWAVGFLRKDAGGSYVPLIIHWNGKSWQVTHFAAEAQLGILYGVSTRSGTDAWAVGTTGPKNGALLLHWNGRRWLRVPAPRPDPSQSLNAVADISSGDAWAVGADKKRELILHWNGKSWRDAPNPGSKMKNGALEDLTALSANEIWTIGYADGPNVLRWNGAAWHVAPASRLPSLGDPLWAIAAVSPDDIWAGGNNANFTDVLMKHWDGTDWSTPKGFEHHIPGVIYRLSIRSASDIWAVGYHGKHQQQRPLMLHWNGKLWTKVLS
jgi:hypothetical protein